MRDDKLGQLLESSDAGAHASQVGGLAHLAADAKTRAVRQTRRTKTSRWVIPSMVLAGGLAFTTAGTDLQTFVLSRPPFVGIDPNDQRPGEGIRYIPSSGGDMGERCLLFVDYRGLSPEESRAIANAIDRGLWERPIAEAAEDALASAGVEPFSAEAQTDAASQVEGDAVNDAVTRLSVEVVPSLDGDAKAITAWTVTCVGGLW